MQNHFITSKMSSYQMAPTEDRWCLRLLVFVNNFLVTDFRNTMVIFLMLFVIEKQKLLFN